jgi:hypothetical protein
MLDRVPLALLAAGVIAAIGCPCALPRRVGYGLVSPSSAPRVAAKIGSPGWRVALAGVVPAVGGDPPRLAGLLTVAEKVLGEGAACPAALARQARNRFVTHRNRDLSCVYMWRR